MGLERLPSDKQHRYWYGLGAISESSCFGPSFGPQALNQVQLSRWAICESSGKADLRERMLKGVIRFSLVLKGALKIIDQRSGFARTLRKGESCLIDAGLGYLLQESCISPSVILNLYFRSNNCKSPARCCFNEHTPENQMIREDEIQLISFALHALQQFAEEFTLQKVKVLLLPDMEKSIALDKKAVYTLYLLKGETRCNDLLLEEHDFLEIHGESELKLKTASKAKILVCKFQ